ncbi:MBL fold metallo-hydrolase [Maricaulis sp.]|uniref:MBL fold metallo-hydrolase n=1 Tax=Maricaulis sp. TaxID=1486257 RepID=UPI0025BD1466|nr:MBL fold metallo-hydrolase [Maricaulis sp.]
MKRMMAGLAGLVLGAAASAASAQDAVGFSVMALSDRLDFLRANTPVGNPSTLLYRGEGFVLVVDPGLEHTSGILAERVAEALAGGQLYTVTTHAHRDHMEASPALPRPLTQIATTYQFNGLAPETGMTRLSVDGEIVLGEGAVRIGSFPLHSSHTGGDLWVHFPQSGVLAVGDHFFLDRYPIIDVDGGGDPAGYFANIDWLVATFPADTRVVPGHSTFGPDEPRIASLDDLADWAGELRNSVSVIREMSAQGLSEAEIVEAGLGPRFAALNERPRFVSEERWIGFVLANPPPG